MNQIKQISTCQVTPSSQSQSRRGLRMMWLCLMVAVMTSLAGCGYSHQSVFPAEYHSVGVDIFANRTFYRGVEFDLTEAVIKEIELRTPYKVVSGDSADTKLEGTVVAINQLNLSRRPQTGLPQEMEIQLMIDFAWRDMRTGQIITDRKGLVVVGRYLPPVDETFSAAQHEAVQKMAAQVVAAMAGQW